jgi:retron-type reverse transcriptase
MKRKGYIIEQIADIDNLRLAFWKAQKGKSMKQEIVLFRENLDARLLQIREQLLDSSYRFGAYHYFTIYDPKKRIICAAPFDERVVHHAIMNICAIDFDKRQIPYSYACRKNRGTFAAVEQAAFYQKKYQWFLKLDVRKYFDSIDHEILFEKLQGIYKDRHLLSLFRKIIDSYHAGDNTGVPIGNLTSQYFANHYLSFADRHAVEQLRIPAYLRYMDDMLLWANDKNELLEKGKQFTRFIHEHLKLELKPFVYNKVEHGLPALGFLLYPDRIRLNRRSRQRFSTKLRQNYTLLEHGEISESEFGNRTLSLYGFINHAGSKGLAKYIMQKIGTDIESSNRVNRGGSWNNNAGNCRVANRNNNSPGNSNNNLGFRLACSSKQEHDFEQMSVPSPETGKNEPVLSG